MRNMRNTVLASAFRPRYSRRNTGANKSQTSMADKNEQVQA